MGVTPHYLLVSPARDAGPAFRPRPPPRRRHGAVPRVRVRGRYRRPRRWAIMTVLGAVAFIAQLDFFIVNVVLDGIGKSFAGSPESLVS